MTLVRLFLRVSWTVPEALEGLEMFLDLGSLASSLGSFSRVIPSSQDVFFEEAAALLFDGNRLHPFA